MGFNWDRCCSYCTFWEDDTPRITYACTHAHLGLLVDCRQRQLDTIAFVVGRYDNRDKPFPKMALRRRRKSRKFLSVEHPGVESDNIYTEKASRGLRVWVPKSIAKATYSLNPGNKISLTVGKLDSYKFFQYTILCLSTVAVSGPRLQNRARIGHTGDDSEAVQRITHQYARVETMRSATNSAANISNLRSKQPACWWLELCLLKNKIWRAYWKPPVPSFV